MNAPTDLNALKSRQLAAWASGDYAVIGTTLQLVGELLTEACDLRCDERVLDVAAGNGNATLAAARRGGRVTSTDYVAALLDRGAERARAEHLEVTFQVADAEALPFEDASFDVVLSTFGVMFSPDQAQAATELARVCRPGGSNRPGQLDARGLCRPGVQDAGAPPAAAGGRAAAFAVGRRGTSAFAVRRTCRRDRGDATAVQLQVSLGRAFHRGLPHLVRTDTQGLRDPARRRRHGTGPRPDRAAEPDEPGRCRLAGRAQRVPRSGHHAALRQTFEPAIGRLDHGGETATARPALWLGLGGT